MTYLYRPYTSTPKTTDKNFIRYIEGGYSHCIKRTKNGYTLPNCVAFVHGMWLKVITDAKGLAEAKRIEAKLCRNNAEVYWKYNDGFERGQTPKLNAIMVWEGKGSRAGHVMTVTEIKSNGDVVATGSDYSGAKFYKRTYYKSKGYNFSSNFNFYGFIYSPYEFVYKTGKPVERNSAVDQIQVITDTLNVRDTYSTKNWSQGYCNTGYYNVLATFENEGYKWYQIGQDMWIANNAKETWCHYLPKTEPHYNLLMENLTEAQKNAMVAWCTGEKVNCEVTEV